MNGIAGTLGIVLVVTGVGCAQSSRQTIARTAESRTVAASTRDFHFEYTTTVTAIPAGAKSLRVWLPIPQTDENQTISNLRIESPLAHRETREAIYGNRMAYFEATGAVPEKLPIKVTFDVRRVETSASSQLTSTGQRSRLLSGDRLAPIAGEAQARADQAVNSSGDVQAKARAIYNRVLADVDYSKAVPGWGQGDLSYVCRVGKGNCSDFHALFISMARSQQIPATFEIGFPLPVDKKEGQVLGYHCWAWYEDAAAGTWRPVDVSEADKDPSRQDYFFGNICCNRVALSRGRDIILEPRQAGEPLNYFVYPHVEVDGKRLETGLEKSFAFKDLNGAVPGD